MTVTLTLLGGVRWEGAAVVGDRSQALLAALAAEPGRPVRAERLVELIWRGEPLANAAKGLQVVVSRTRAACGAAAVVRDGAGYRLGLELTQVDSALLGTLVAQARRLVAADPRAAADQARQALELGAALPSVPADEQGPLADVRRAAERDLTAARLLLARARSRTGQHAEAFPVLLAAWARAEARGGAGSPPGRRGDDGDDGDDEELLADLLRSEAAVRGAGAALERYERYRRDLRERLGTSPGEALVRVQRDLLARDRPVRTGISHDATPLLGRQHDVERLLGLLGQSRVVSIVGPGGLGKTRLANLLAREAELPTVHVVGLVGVSAPEDLLGEIGSALGVRESIGERRVLTPAQRADLRSRIAARLSRGPTLLVLDNCEHVLAEVAGLVAFLVATVADLRVLTTSRAPLAIGAEQVHLLGELAHPDAVELFRQRAAAARRSVRLDDEVVGRIVRRLDGLPLAIELAAARVRVMSVHDIDRRLADRFALLRSGDRTAPDRHRTLLAVIDWSWNLLAAPERRSLRWLSLFPDGFTLDAATDVLAEADRADRAEPSAVATDTDADAADAMDTVQALVDQSLLGVRESAGGVRYRMLETVREFGRLRLAEAGELAAARRALRVWAVGHASRHGAELTTAGQFAAIDAVAAEETNLADELRAALADGDVEAAVRLVAVLGTFWEIRGEHTRILLLLDAINAVLSGWTPPPPLRTVALTAVTVVARTMLYIGDGGLPAALRELLVELCPRAGDDPRLQGTARALLAIGQLEPAQVEARLAILAADADRHTRLVCLVWLTHWRENAGAQRAAAEAATEALTLVTARDGPWITALLHAQLAELTMQLGEADLGRSHAQAALPVLERLGARDDVAQLHVALAIDAINDGRFAQAEDYLDGIDPSGGAPLGGAMLAAIGRAELTLARGDIAEGLRRHRAATTRMRQIQLPGVELTGTEPWVVVADALSLAAFTWHATTADELATGRGLFRDSLRRCVTTLRREATSIDYPACGALLFALGAWCLRHGTDGEGRTDGETLGGEGLDGETLDGLGGGGRAWVTVGEAVELLALARRFSHVTTTPSLSWPRVEELAERRAPGALRTAKARAGDQADRRQPLDEARLLVDRLVERLVERRTGSPTRVVRAGAGN
ncbi:AAA family ATPase [Frankia sp. AgPm24]|uniref:ATP-binding protein n=1 Tax=Frankia sp. AgPm24 TaxID=631128 RepID=UPI002010B8F9|nr:AAA family ATPase [Frankia sp. AgPm24]MCK9923860.1 AAA family ATPase [Frankia sp. AgPm24]